MNNYEILKRGIKLISGTTQINRSMLEERTNNKWLLLFFCMVAALRLSSAETANASYLLIAAFSLLGRTQAIQALALSWLFTMLNPALAPEASGASIGRYLVIFAAALSVGWRGLASGSGFSIKKLSLLTLYLGLFMLVHSLLFSAVVDVSVLKVVSWAVVVLTLLSAWQGLAAEQRLALLDQLHWGLVWLLLLSVPLLAIPGIGYFRNGTGFQGLLNHPQAFGPTVALVGVLVGGRMLGDQKPAWRDIALLGLCLVLVVLSEARTAGIAMVLGLVGSALLSPGFAGVSRRRMLPGLRSRRFQAVALVAVLGVVLAGPLLAGKISSYLFKRSDTSSLLAAADASRGALVQKMFENIKKNPWTGIGFGIASEPAYMEVERDPFLGLPLSALVEKGVMPIAVVEELGVFGALAVLGWVWVVLRRGARSGVPQFAVLITLLLVNFGESMFFSVGGMGMLLLVLLTGAVSTGPRAARGAASDA